MGMSGASRILVAPRSFVEGVDTASAIPTASICVTVVRLLMPAGYPPVTGPIPGVAAGSS